MIVDIVSCWSGPMTRAAIDVAFLFRNYFSSDETS